MSSSESDVSWQSLRRIAKGWAGNSAEIAEVRHLHGGSVADTLAVHLADGTKAVLKISCHRVDRSLPREAQQLAHLRLLGVPVPTVYGWKLADLDEPDSFLLMEFIEGVDLGEAKKRCSSAEYDELQRDLAAIVLRMHEHTGPVYMRVGDDGECADWPAFFRGIYETMWRELEKSPHTTKACRRAFNKIHEALPALLAHDDRPRLVHWDLWSSNILAQRVREGWRVSAVLDPMCKYAHYEAELAYLEMFETVTPTFMKVYKERLRPPEAYSRIRREVYQLYHTMDHAAFFGGKYHAKFAAAAERVGAMV